MGVDTALQPVTGVAHANYFDVIHYDVQNRGEGVADVVLSVWWRAALKEPRTPTKEDPRTFTLTPAREMGPYDFYGAELRALCADAFDRAVAYKQQGADAGAAYALGQRDAIYAALKTAKRFRA